MKCPICNKELKSDYALRAHHWRVHTEKGKSFKVKKHIAWNKGLTKDTNEIVKKNAENISKTLKEKVKNGTYVVSRYIVTDEIRSKMSKAKSTNPSGGWCKWHTVNGVRLQGTYERDIAKKMCDFNIDWIKPSKTPISFNLDNKNRLYNPDFYLPEYNIFFEVKGYWWGDAKEKMKAIFSQNPSLKRRIKFIREPKLLKLLKTKNKKEFEKELHL